MFRAYEIIQKYSKFGLIPWEFPPENSFFSFRVGVSVGGQVATNFLLISKDTQKNSMSFDTSLVRWVRAGKMVLHEKLDFTRVKFAEVD